MKLPKQLELLEKAGQQIVAGLDLHGKSLSFPKHLRDNAESALRELASADPQYDKPSPLFMQAIGPALAKANYLAGSAIGRAKDVLKGHLGDEWSDGWVEAGFANSIQTPVTAPERIELLASLSAYFESHPERQDANSDVTVGLLSLRGQELDEAFQSSNEHSRAWSAGVSSRTVAGERLRAALLAILAELEKSLPAGDARWEAFTVNCEPEVVATPVRRGRPRKEPLPQALQASVPRPPSAKSDSTAEFQLWQYARQLAEKAKVQADQARQALAQAEATVQRLRAEADQATVMAKSLQAKADLLAPAGSKSARPDRSLANERVAFDMPLPG
jgi:hypothetical protein